VLRAASFYAALRSTVAVATAITAIVVAIATALKAEPTAAHLDVEVGARSAVLSRWAGGSTGRIRLLSVPLPSGKRGSAHHSLRRLATCYPVLRMESSEHSPWRALGDDLNDSSYLQRFSVWMTHAA
jgi:hypothetical protein